MIKSGPGRPGAQNKYFWNKALIETDQIRGRAARSSKWIFSKYTFIRKWAHPGLGGQEPQISNFE